MILEKDLFKVGFLGKTHGLDGFINFHSEYDVLDSNDYNFLILLIDGIFVPFCIDQYRLKSENVSLVKFLDLNKSESVLRYQSTEVYYPIEYQEIVMGTKPVTSFWAGLIHYTIVDNNDTVIGKITKVDEQTINTLLELTNTDETQIIVPGVKDWILNLDHQTKKIIYTLPEGLL